MGKDDATRGSAGRRLTKWSVPPVFIPWTWDSGGTEKGKREGRQETTKNDVSQKRAARWMGLGATPCGEREKSTVRICTTYEVGDPTRWVLESRCY
jgi:hypothetical protein